MQEVSPKLFLMLPITNTFGLGTDIFEWKLGKRQQLLYRDSKLEESAWLIAWSGHRVVVQPIKCLNYLNSSYTSVQVLKPILI